MENFTSHMKISTFSRIMIIPRPSHTHLLYIISDDYHDRCQWHDQCSSSQSEYHFLSLKIMTCFVGILIESFLGIESDIADSGPYFCYTLLSLVFIFMSRDSILIWSNMDSWYSSSDREIIFPHSSTSPTDRYRIFPQRFLWSIYHQEVFNFI